ncbi:MAG: peptidoglycan-binding domain-containing protein, partial [Patescibacteria group bacterium]
FAAFDDVTLGSSAVLSVGGVTLNVTGSSNSIASITVGSTNFTVSVESGSTLNITAPNGNQIFPSATNSNITITTVCTASASTLAIASNVTSVITVTPDVAVCPTTTTTSSSGGNGPVATGGGGGGGVATYGNTPTVPAPATQTGSPSQSAQTAKFAALTKILAKGSKGAGVKVLQQMLNADPDTQVSLSGAGSPGSETTLFGNATLAAVKKFQVKWGIAKPGVQGYGNLGPKTRAKLNVLFAQ